jgi:hypothetical protein
VADELGLPLNTQLRDLGLSAFRGAHRTKGDLAMLYLVSRSTLMPNDEAKDKDEGEGNR